MSGKKTAIVTVAQDQDRVRVAKAKTGDAGAFGELYERYCLRTHRIANRILRNDHDAEDVVQRCFQRAFVNLSQFRGDSSFSTWVTRIAINEALMMLRQRRPDTQFSQNDNEGAGEHSSIDPSDHRPTPEQALAQLELRSSVIHAVSKLRNSLRVVVLLRELYGLTTEETARRLGLSVAAVKARAFHARRCLRKHLDASFRKEVAA
jgi:RNA polymerase sigma-70 factor (ECF subfamily)